MRQDFIPVNTFPSPVLAVSGSEGLISARCFKAPHCVINIKKIVVANCWLYLD